MKTAKRQTPPFATAAQFFRLTRLHEHFDRLAEDVRIRRALESAGFRLRKIQRERFRFTLVTACAQRLTRSMPPSGFAPPRLVTVYPSLR